MFLPESAIKGVRAPLSDADGVVASSLSHALAELSSTRDEVMHAVTAAPERRVDNLITRTHDATALLRMHARVLEEVRMAYVVLRRRIAAISAAFLAFAPATAYAMLVPLDGVSIVSISSTTLAAVAAGTCISASALAAVHGRASLVAAHMSFQSESELDALFKRLHAVEVSQGDEYVRSLWLRARPHLQAAIPTLSLGELQVCTIVHNRSPKRMFHPRDFLRVRPLLFACGLSF